MTEATIATAPPEQSDVATRSRWGAFAPNAERAVLNSLLLELAPNRDELPAALAHKVGIARDSGLSDQVASDLLALAAESPDGMAIDHVMPLLIELFYFARNTSALKKYRIVHPAYRVFDDHYQNAEEPGGSVIQVPATAHDRKWRFLGRDIAFPIGVGASGLTTNTSCVQRLFGGGYSIVTYKTVRSRARAPFRAPNWAFTEPVTSSEFDEQSGSLRVARNLINPSYTSTVNSFGVPSYSPDVWMLDLARAASQVALDQVLICSVLGEDYSNSPTARGLTADFVEVSKLAYAAGATNIELNLSCPNTLTPEGQVRPALCEDRALTAAIVRAVRESLPSQAKLGIKLSALDQSQLIGLLMEVSPLVHFVCGINTIPRPVASPDGADFFPGRAVAGVGGEAIAHEALQFVEVCAQFRKDQAARFEIVGLGGVVDPSSFDRLYRAGADVVQSVSGVFRNSFLAQDCISELRDTLPGTPSDRLRGAILRSLSGSVSMPMWRLGASLDEHPAAISEAIQQLVVDGVLVELTRNDGSPQYLRAVAHSTLEASSA